LSWKVRHFLQATTKWYFEPSNKIIILFQRGLRTDVRQKNSTNSKFIYFFFFSLHTFKHLYHWLYPKFRICLFYVYINLYLIVYKLKQRESNSHVKKTSNWFYIFRIWQASHSLSSAADFVCIQKSYCILSWEQKENENERMGK